MNPNKYICLKNSDMNEHDENMIRAKIAFKTSTTAELWPNIEQILSEILQKNKH